MSEVDTKARTCPATGCGKPVPPSGRPRTYCSPECSETAKREGIRAWQRKNRERLKAERAARRAALPPRTCARPGCGATCPPSAGARPRIYCTRACSVKAAAARHADVAKRYREARKAWASGAEPTFAPAPAAEPADPHAARVAAHEQRIRAGALVAEREKLAEAARTLIKVGRIGAALLRELGAAP